MTAACEAHPGELWPEQALSALHNLNTAALQARDQDLTQIPPEVADPLHERWRHAILCGLATDRPRPRRKQTKTRNLLVRLRDRDEQILRFARDLTVPFTNNQAECDLRPAKTQLKISGCHRSDTGARAWTRVRGYISTVRKHGDDVLTPIRDAITGDPWTRHRYSRPEWLQSTSGDERPRRSRHRVPPIPAGRDDRVSRCCVGSVGDNQPEH